MTALRLDGEGRRLLDVIRANTIVERHGGSVWGEGEVGQGAVFYLALPELEGRP